MSDAFCSHSDSLLDLSGNKAEAHATETAADTHEHLSAEELPDIASYVVSNLSILNHDVLL